MGSLIIALARLLIVAPFLAGAVLAGLDYGAASAAFAESYPQLADAYPAILGVTALLSLAVVLGLPFHRFVAGLLAVLVLLAALWQSAFWNEIGSAEIAMQKDFLMAVAHAGAFLLIAVMPRP